MIFRRKNQIDQSVEANKELNTDSEFVSLGDVNFKKKISVDNAKKLFHDSINNIKEELIQRKVDTQLFLKNNKYNIWKCFVAFFSIFILVFTFFLAFYPFSYAYINQGVSSPITHFYTYNGSMLVPSTVGIVYIVFFLIAIGVWVGHLFVYRKFEQVKYIKDFQNKSKRYQAFFWIKYLSWTLFFTSFLFMLIAILIPPNINAYSKYIENQNIINIIVTANNDFTLIEKIESGVITSSQLDVFFQLAGVAKPSGDVNEIATMIRNLITGNYNNIRLTTNVIDGYFYSIAVGGISSLNAAGISFLVLALFFSIAGVILFVSKVINAYLTNDRLQKFKLENIQFNMFDVRENILSINNKFRGIYDTSKQKYQEFKDKDTFRKYKKRLVEEGKDTNPDKFTTDVYDPNKTPSSKKESLFNVLKDVYKDKVHKHDVAETYNTKNRMKPPKPEIAIPDDELDELIDSLDIK